MNETIVRNDAPVLSSADMTELQENRSAEREKLDELEVAAESTGKCVVGRENGMELWNGFYWYIFGQNRVWQSAVWKKMDAVPCSIHCWQHRGGGCGIIGSPMVI